MPTIRLFKQYIQIPFLVLAAMEGALLFGSMYAGSLIRFGDLSDAGANMGDVMPRALAFAALMLLGMSSMGLYQHQQTKRLGQFLLRLLAAFTLGWLGLLILFYTYPDLYSGRGVLILSIVSGVVAVAIIRPLFYRIIDDSSFKPRILVLGAGNRALEVMRSSLGLQRNNFQLRGFVPNGNEEIRINATGLVHPGLSLGQYCAENRIDEIVVAADDRRNSFPMKELLECKLQGVSVLEPMTFFEREEGRVRLGMLYPGWLVFCDGCTRSMTRQASKRAFDIVAAASLLIVSFPIMLLTAIAIKLEDGLRAPLFYRQRRVGEGGKVFDVLKFRSMSVDAEVNGKAKWASKNDARITKVGWVTRRTRIDELPQLINVLNGEMSFVGPRPERPEFVSGLAEDIPYYDERHCLKPGITGWAQVKYPYGASVEDSKRKLEYDLFYVKNHNLLLDFYILLSTAEVVLFGKGR